MSLVKRNNVRIIGEGAVPLVFAHGYGCDQNMWRFITPAFEKNFKIMLFDHVGAGNSDLTAYDRLKYGTLDGYASDVLELCSEFGLEDVVYVGHSVSAMVGVLAAIKDPDRFSQLVLIGPSPCYINDGDYIGGFTKPDILGMLELLDSNYLGWSAATAPVIMGNPDRPELSAELTNSFCRTDPEIAKHFAHVTFLSDNRGDLPKSRIPSLILQCSEDFIAPPSVGPYVRRNLPDSSLLVLKATGHCPHLSAPQETISAMQSGLQIVAKAKVA